MICEKWNKIVHLRSVITIWSRFDSRNTSILCCCIKSAPISFISIHDDVSTCWHRLGFLPSVTRLPASGTYAAHSFNSWCKQTFDSNRFDRFKRIILMLVLIAISNSIIDRDLTRYWDSSAWFPAGNWLVELGAKLVCIYRSMNVARETWSHRIFIAAKKIERSCIVDRISCNGLDDPVDNKPLTCMYIYIQLPLYF